MTANAFILAWMVSILGTAGDEPVDAKQASNDNARAAESSALAGVEVKKFAFQFERDREAMLTLRPTPVFRATNPLRGEVYANWYVWTHQGRPDVIASVSNWYLPRRYLGLAVTSLSAEKVVGLREGQEIWQPRRVGVELKPIPDANPPAETSIARLTQMRKLARDFTAEFKREASQPEGGKLRLLTQPLYRYENVEGVLIDGAIFAFANGTAPQLALLIEARKSPSGALFEYALAPMNSTEFHVWHNEREVWNLPQVAPPWPNSQNPTNTYTVFPDLTDEGRTHVLADRLLQARKTPAEPPGK